MAVSVTAAAAAVAAAVVVTVGEEMSNDPFKLFDCNIPVSGAHKFSVKWVNPVESVHPACHPPWSCRSNPWGQVCHMNT